MNASIRTAIRFSIAREAQRHLPVRRGAALSKFIVFLIVAAGVIVAAYYMFSKPAVNPAEAYPTSAKKMINQFFQLISTGSTSADQKAFKLLSLPIRKIHEKHPGRYWQRFEDLNVYLTDVFGTTWTSDIHIVRSKNPEKPDEYIAHVRTEVFHITVANQDRYAAALPHPHYGLVRIREFSFSGGAHAQQVAANTSVLGALGLQGAAHNVAGISAAYSAVDNLKPWQIKHRLLPVVLHPHAAALGPCIYQLWPVRKDPTVRMVLKQIAHDPQYAVNIQQEARKVLSGHVSDATLIANQVTHIHPSY